MAPHKLSTYKDEFKTIEFCTVCSLEWPYCLGECPGREKTTVDKKIDTEKERS
jgi:hypothetical protein